MKDLFSLMADTEGTIRQLYDPTAFVTIEFAPDSSGYVKIKPLNGEESFELDFDDYDDAIELLVMLSAITEESLQDFAKFLN